MTEYVKFTTSAELVIKVIEETERDLRAYVVNGDYQFLYDKKAKSLDIAVLTGPRTPSKVFFKNVGILARETIPEEIAKHGDYNDMIAWAQDAIEADG